MISACIDLCNNCAKHEEKHIPKFVLPAKMGSKRGRPITRTVHANLSVHAKESSFCQLVAVLNVALLFIAISGIQFCWFTACKHHFCDQNLFLMIIQKIARFFFSHMLVMIPGMIFSSLQWDRLLSFSGSGFFLIYAGHELHTLNAEWLRPSVQRYLAAFKDKLKSIPFRL